MYLSPWDHNDAEQVLEPPVGLLPENTFGTVREEQGVRVEFAARESCPNEWVGDVWECLRLELRGWVLRHVVVGAGLVE